MSIETWLSDLRDEAERDARRDFMRTAISLVGYRARGSTKSMPASYVFEVLENMEFDCLNKVVFARRKFGEGRSASFEKRCKGDRGFPSALCDRDTLARTYERVYVDTCHDLCGRGRALAIRKQITADKYVANLRAIADVEGWREFRKEK